MSFIDAREWSGLWSRLGLQGNPDRALKNILSHYDEPHRHYHDGSHIRFCLERMGEIRQHLRHPDRVMMAIIWHDIVYEVSEDRYPFNEEYSGLHAVEFFGLHKGAVEDAEAVGKMIVATKHTTPPDDDDTRYLVDIDLSSLGLQYLQFEKNMRLVRREFQHFADHVFFPKHYAVLRKLLERPHIFCTNLMRQRFERQARENLLRYLAAVAA